MSLLTFAGRHGRWCLVAGLIAGLTLPGLALSLVPWLPHMIAALLFLNALRIGPRAALGSLADATDSLRLLLIYQLGLPLLLLSGLFVFGMADTAPALALVLMLAAPSVTGSPNFTTMLGHDPARAMRLLLLGTAIFPLTVIPVLIALPGVETFAEVSIAALRLLGVIAVSVGLAFVLRWAMRRPLTDTDRAALDGVSALLLAFVVIGLMSAAGPTIRTAPTVFAGWLAFAFVVNFGLQITMYLLLRPRSAGTVGAAIVAGNRNIALFLVALPPDTTAPLLIFIACYQVPMYLTPILMGRVYRQDGQRGR